MTRDEILKKYLEVCADAVKDDEVFRSFKAHPHYKEVLEHCSAQLGMEHLSNIRRHNKGLLVMKQFWANDRVGNPYIVDYGTIKASPTTLQYISVLSNLIDLYGTLKDMAIVEIGGGYGGQAKIIQDVFKVESYDIIDLYECTLLQNRYARELQILTVKTHTNENYEIKEWDLFISNYAVSEVSDEDQLKYVKDIMLNCKHGYITCNQPLNGLELLKEKFKVTISKDIKGEREDNFLITW